MELPGIDAHHTSTVRPDTVIHLEHGPNGLADFRFFIRIYTAGRLTYQHPEHPQGDTRGRELFERVVTQHESGEDLDQ